jgi:hypothetical protein
MLDTMKCEARRRGPDVLATWKSKTPSLTSGQATLMAPSFPRRCNDAPRRAWPRGHPRQRLLHPTPPLPLRLPPMYNKSASPSFPIPISPHPTSRRTTQPLQSRRNVVLPKSVAENDFGRGSLTVAEAWALYRAGYPVPPDMRLPSSGSWRMAVNGVGVLLPPLQGT